MPATADMVATASFPDPSPGASEHTTEVDDAHAAVRQLDRPRRDEGVASRDPKPSPDIVTLHPALVAAFFSPTKLTTGAGKLQQRPCHARQKRSLLELLASEAQCFSIITWAAI